MKIFTMNGNSYLGKKEDNTITGMPLRSGNGQVTSSVFAEYLKQKQIDQLVEVELGNQSDVTSRKLTKLEKLALNAVKAEFNLAKDMAEDWLINKVFDEIREGKK